MEMSVIITYSNRLVDILNLDESDEICIEDIAHSLANKCRFNGHCNRFYSIAEHCLLSTMLAPSELKLAALMHERAEPFMGDIIGPIKRSFSSIFMPLEKSIEKHIDNSLGLPTLNIGDKKTLKYIDNKLLITEAESLFDEPYSDTRFQWPKDTLPFDIGLMYLSPEKAKEIFMDCFMRLTCMM